MGISGRDFRGQGTVPGTWWCAWREVVPETGAGPAGTPLAGRVGREPPSESEEPAALSALEARVGRPSPGPPVCRSRGTSRRVCHQKPSSETWDGAHGGAPGRRRELQDWRPQAPWTPGPGRRRAWAASPAMCTAWPAVCSAAARSGARRRRQRGGEPHPRGRDDAAGAEATVGCGGRVTSPFSAPDGRSPRHLRGRQVEKRLL